MPVRGMGTEVHLKSFLPEYFKMRRDLSEDTTGVWVPFKDGTLSGQMYNGLVSRTVNGCSEYYKALLRQTMLSHEEIFRKQVMELHRLYRVQKDLMLERKRQEEQFFPPQVQSSRSGLTSMESSINKINHLPRTPIDLQLPADAYVDNDDVGCSGDRYISRRHHGYGEHSNERDVSLTLGSSTVRQSAHVHKLADLNEPLEEAGCEQVPFLFRAARCEGVEEHQKKSGGFLGCFVSASYEKEAHLSSESFLFKPPGDHLSYEFLSSCSTASSKDAGIASKSRFLGGAPRDFLSDGGFSSRSSFKKPSCFVFDGINPPKVDLNLAPPNGFHYGLDSPDDQSHKVTGFSVAIAAAGQERETEMTASSERTRAEEESSGFKGRIDLNSDATVGSSDDEMVAFFPSTRYVSEIDLEAPVISLSDDLIPSAESETEDARANAAAEAIQMMSLSVEKSSSPDSAAALLMLADVSSLPAELDEMDYFECQALELKETTMDELCCCFKTSERDGGDAEEEIGRAANLLLNMPRRGPAKRRRQRRDFQKDILPGLASLSRHEVTEDLQLIGGLMRTSGQPWQPHRGQTQCRRRARAAAAAAAASAMAADPQPCADAETGVMSTLGWGRTTRRGRRQRCPPGHAVALPVG